MRRCRQPERYRHQQDARPPFASWALHRVGHAHGRVHQPIEPPHGQYIVVRRHRVAHDCGTEAVKPQREEAALIAEQTPRDPPQPTAQPQREEDKRQVQQVLHAEELVPRLPGRTMERAFGVQPVRPACAACPRRALPSAARSAETPRHGKQRCRRRSDFRRS